MSTRETSGAQDPIIESRDQLVAPMQRGEKPTADWRIGTEHEKLVYGSKDHRALSYEEEGGIRDILLSLR
jgi:glutamate--cysteine ligase